ncbi:MAG: hypothetical protein KDA33_03345, partial [Phycisphaerales bacterium]|nr:hypothetical protein [Phycisphaerales bacterium]
LDFFNSIWLGIFLIVLIFCYGTLGSAVPQTRQVFELTEFQYFNHWIFTALIVLFCINLIVATIRRIKFNLINAGVLAVHTGLLLLCGSSIWYFGSKVEGDVLMAPPSVGIYSQDRLRANRMDPFAARIGQVVAAKGRSWDMNIPMLGGAHKVEVIDVKRRGMDMSEEVTLKVTIGNGPSREIKLSMNESGDGPAPFAEIGTKLVAILKPASPVTRFYDNTTPSLSLVVGDTLDDRREFSLPALPYYSERFIALNDDKSPGAGRVDYTDGTPVPSNRTAPIPLVEYWRMPIPVLKPEHALAKDLGYTIEIDGYLPYADMDARPIEGGGDIYPVAQVAMGRGNRLTSEDLESLNPAKAMFDIDNGPRMEFDWIGDETELNPDWTRRVEGRHIIDVEIKDKGVRNSYDVNVGDEIKVEGTDYTLKIEQLRPNWPLMTAGFKGARTSIALVWVESPAQSYQRSVMDRFPQLNQDRNREGAKISSTSDLVDDNIVITYTNAATDHIRLVAGENFAPTIIHTAVGGGRDVKKLEIGEPIALGDDLNLVLKNLIVRPVLEARPAVIPMAQRRSLMNVGRQKSMIRVHLAALDGSWSRRLWVGFSQYNLDHTDIFGGGPTMVGDLPSGRQIGLIYGRQRNDLPSPVVLEELVTQYYPGGQQAREWTSYFSYKVPGTEDVRAGKAFLNNTYTIGNWT